LSVEPRREPGGAEQARWKSLRVLFDEVVELPRAERRSALERACGADRGLIEEVLALLQEAERGDDFLVPPAGLRAPGAAHVGRFVLERMLAPGRVGTVHLARNVEDGRLLALRIVALESVAREEDLLEPVARLRGSARSLAALDHPALARNVESGLCAWPAGSDRSALYFATEFVPGASPLDAYCRDHALPSLRCVELLLAACDGIAHAHAAGVVHGALSGANVLVSVEEHVHVVDLGVRTVFPGERPPSAVGDRIALAELLADLLARAPEDARWRGPMRELARRAADADAGDELASVASFAASLRRELDR